MTKEIVSKVCETIESRTGYSRSHISNVIHGRRNNETITNLFKKEYDKLVKKAKEKTKRRKK